MYPIGSVKGALNSKRTPSFIGTLKFKKDENGKNHLNRFIANFNVNENSSLYEKFYPPQEAIKILKSQIVFMSTHDDEMEEYLDSIDVSYRFTTVCSHCILEKQITIINSDSSYKFHNQRICKQCGEDAIKRELKLRGYDKRVFRNFKKILGETSDLETVLDILSPKFDPLKHPDLTLYDRVKIDNTQKIPDIDMSRLKIPKNFREILINEGNKKLLPVQILAIKEGLLKGENLLVVSATGSGKTLVGEIAGIPQVLNGKKFIFLTPLVALANQKYRDFKRKYRPLGMEVSIKVGRNRVKAKGELNLPDKSISDSNIIVATYEALDYMIRSGNHNDLKNLGVCLIDEIHMIDDEQRGSRLNGLIKRLKYLSPDTQIIGLSATVKNPDYLADKFNMQLVQYSNRPVPLERHLSFVRNDAQKREIMRRLIIQEHHTKSSKGYKGQTIIFTNSRRKTTQIAKFLTDKGIKAGFYHGGLSYYKKEKIEKDFDEGKLEAVVTTAALSAGVDFPASQVIFETLLMGNKWISPNEFSQMIGRAGRPSYHDRGVVYLLPEIGRRFDEESEESVALDLLESDTEDVNIIYDEDDLKEQILADVSSETIKTKSDLKEFYSSADIPTDPIYILKILIKHGFISTENSKLMVSDYGRSVSKSFLSIDDAEFIKKSLFNTNYFNDSYYILNNVERILHPSSIYYKDIVRKSTNVDKEKSNKIFKIIDKKELNQLKVKTIGMDLELFDSAYLSPVIHNQIANKLKLNISSRLFSESTLDIISSGDTISKLDSKYQDALIKLQLDFLRCECMDKPFCDCLQRGISYLIINERLKGEDPINISKTLFSNYQIHTYPGDIFSWLDNYIKNLDSVKRIAYAFDNKKLQAEAEYLIKEIENPHKSNNNSNKHSKDKFNSTKKDKNNNNNKSNGSKSKKNKKGNKNKDKNKDKDKDGDKDKNKNRNKNKTKVMNSKNRDKNKKNKDKNKYNKNKGNHKNKDNSNSKSKSKSKSNIKEDNSENINKISNKSKKTTETNKSKNIKIKNKSNKTDKSVKIKNKSNKTDKTSKINNITNNNTYQIPNKVITKSQEKTKSKISKNNKVSKDNYIKNTNNIKSSNDKNNNSKQIKKYTVRNNDKNINNINETIVKVQKMKQSTNENKDYKKVTNKIKPSKKDNENINNKDYKNTCN
ncbi:DEAD/DEAH box helicase [uncultured Methanobrevibacter sp.]|uniref:DEAD/DEAH box helicase n=1 Tax=uncultured Methanobrevibacter sp. TaxID=253161 RepID=UPI0025EA8CF3|nr:DEAD/DEAH box helicase [uncultured Methanobrevibacter sp.]